MSELFYKAAGAIIAPFRYAEREVKHMKEEAIEDIQTYIANLIKLAIIGVAFIFFLLFISITVAAAINNRSDNGLIGWVIVAGFYLLVGIGLYIWKEMSEKKKPASGVKRTVNT